MNLDTIATFLNDHPDWSPSFSESTKGKSYIDGFYNSTGRFETLETVQLLLATCAESGGVSEKA